MSDSPFILISEELFECAKSSSFSGSYDLSHMDSGPDTYDFDAPLVWNVTVTNTGDALLVEGDIKGVARTACARCLDPFEVAIEGDVEGYFLLSAEDRAPEGIEEFDVLPENKIIDLKPLLDAAILLEFPLIPLCKEECKGLCSECGENLNEVECSCKKDHDDFEKEKNPFSILEDYPFE